MNIFTVSFFGHRIIDRPFPIEQQLEKLIRELLTEKEYVEFLVGRDGDDQLVSSSVRRCKRAIRDDNSALFGSCPTRRRSIGTMRTPFIITTMKWRSAVLRRRTLQGSTPKA